jgi:hypothetical protein
VRAAFLDNAVLDSHSWSGLISKLSG